jgi:uncharacterized small protein (DUF1192 family)
MITRKTKSKAIKKHPEGYRVFMSGFAEYARENGIHIHGGRGSFAKKAGQVWKDLKGKPEWKENLDVVLPQYLKGVEGAEPGMSLQDRKARIVSTISHNEYSWWSLKNLYGIWSESVYTNTDTDRLIIIDAENEKTDISDEIDVFYMAQNLKDLADAGQIDQGGSGTSYFKFNSVKENESGGLDVAYELEQTSEYRIHLHKKDTFRWGGEVREKFEVQKEIIEEAGEEGKKLPTFKKALEERHLAEIDVEKVRESKERLSELNKAIDRLESQLKRKLITKAQYSKYLNKLYLK